MAKMVCAVKHFGAGGKEIPVGTEKEGKPDGHFWVAASGKSEQRLEVATPSKSSKDSDKGKDSKDDKKDSK